MDEGATGLSGVGHISLEKKAMVFICITFSSIDVSFNHSLKSGLTQYLESVF